MKSADLLVMDAAISRLRQQLLPQPAAAGQWPQAAVLIALDASGDAPSVVLTRRAQQLRLHAGEVAFPGGKCDADDRDYWHTATREAQEEIGLRPELLEPLGTLAPLVTRTSIEVVPCVALLAETVGYRPNPAEIATVFEVPLAFFARPEQLQFETYDYAGRARRVPCYQWREHRIWGITAAMLVQLANLGYDAGLDLDAYWQGGQDGRYDYSVPGDDR